jgi:hypothetical protein
VFRYTLDVLDVPGEQVVFLDDIGLYVPFPRVRRAPVTVSFNSSLAHSNLKAAQHFGIKTIRASFRRLLSRITPINFCLGVHVGRVEDALKELGDLVGIDLVSPRAHPRL